MDNRPRVLFITKLNDGLYHFIGVIHEQELHDLSIKGFKTYQEAIDIRNKFNYKEWKSG